MGIEPQWLLTLRIDHDLVGTEKLANVVLDSTYMLADLSFRPDMVIDREQWVRVLIHECVHLYMADIATYGLPWHPSVAPIFKVADERSTSLIEHIIFSLFEKVYRKEYKVWL